MSDLVVTVPKRLWWDWLEEGDCAGEPPSGEEWHFYLGGGRPPIQRGERLYIVAHGRVRGYAPVVRVESTGRGWAIVRHAGAVAVTIPVLIGGFRGWRRRWWPREDERPFPAWRTEGAGPVPAEYICEHEWAFPLTHSRIGYCTKCSIQRYFDRLT